MIQSKVPWVRNSRGAQEPCDDVTEVFIFMFLVIPPLQEDNAIFTDAISSKLI